jgi:hypothetical protein
MKTKITWLSAMISTMIGADNSYKCKYVLEIEYIFVQNIYKYTVKTKITCISAMISTMTGADDSYKCKYKYSPYT